MKKRVYVAAAAIVLLSFLAGFFINRSIVGSERRKMSLTEEQKEIYGILGRFEMYKTLEDSVLKELYSSIIRVNNLHDKLVFYMICASQNEFDARKAEFKEYISDSELCRFVGYDDEGSLFEGDFISLPENYYILTSVAEGRGVTRIRSGASANRFSKTKTNAVVEKLLEEFGISGSSVRNIKYSEISKLTCEYSRIKHENVNIRTVGEKTMTFLKEEGYISDKGEEKLNSGDIVYVSLQVKNLFGRIIAEEKDIPLILGYGLLGDKADELIIGSQTPISVSLRRKDLKTAFLADIKGSKVTLTAGKGFTAKPGLAYEVFCNQWEDDELEAHQGLRAEFTDKLLGCAKYTVGNITDNFREYVRHAIKQEMIFAFLENDPEAYLKLVGAKSSSLEEYAEERAELEIKEMLLIGALAEEYHIEYCNDYFFQCIDKFVTVYGVENSLLLEYSILRDTVSCDLGFRSAWIVE